MVVETSQEAHRAVVDGGAAEHNAAGENSIGDGSIGGEGMMKNQVTLPASMVEELESGHDVVESLGQELRTKLYEVHKLQDKFEQAVGKQKKAVKNAKSEFGASKTQIAKYTEALKDWESLMPTTGGWFTRAFLGVHNVRFHRKKERMLFKQDYELFKQRTAPVIILLCLVALYFDSYRGIHIVFQLYLAYYYVNLSLREGILQKNGSNIKPWWSIHHYISMLSAVLLLTWPSSASYNLFAQKLHLFGLYMGVVQIFQTRYAVSHMCCVHAKTLANLLFLSLSLSLVFAFALQNFLTNEASSGDFAFASVPLFSLISAERAAMFGAGTSLPGSTL